MAQINLTTLEGRVLDALHGDAINRNEVAWINDDERRFVNFSDASNWAIKNGLTTIASDEQIITTIFSLIERGLVKQTDSRSKSSVWFSVPEPEPESKPMTEYVQYNRVPAGELKTALHSLKNVIAKKPDELIFGAVCLRFTGNEATVTGYGAGAFLQARMDNVGPVATIVTPYADLVAAIKHAKKTDTVEFATGANKLTVKVGSNETTLYMLPADDFPEAPELTDPSRCHVIIDKEKLEALIAHALTNDTRPALKCILVEQTQDRITLVSTDTKRMVKEELEKTEGTPVRLLVPAKFVQAVITSPGTCYLEFAISDNGNTLVSCGSTTVTMTSETDTFPNWERVIPADEDDDHVITGVKADLEAAIAAVQSVAKDANYKIILKFSSSSAELLAQDLNGRIARAKLHRFSATQDIVFAVNYRFVQDAIKHRGEDLTIRLAGPSRPIRFFNEDDPKSIATIMPMALPDIVPQ